MVQCSSDLGEAPEPGLRSPARSQEQQFHSNLVLNSGILRINVCSIIITIHGAATVRQWQWSISTFVENPLQIAPFLSKQTQFYAILPQKRRFQEKTNPNKPN